MHYSIPGILRMPWECIQNVRQMLSVLIGQIMMVAVRESKAKSLHKVHVGGA